MALQLADSAFEEGLIIYPRRSIHGLSGDHVLVAPPLTVTADQIDEILNRMERALVKIPRTP
jgi:adenosylmethionine-8-amino-7-oxononanoate aminotransferase